MTCLGSLKIGWINIKPQLLLLSPDWQGVNNELSKEIAIAN
jgi:hypothetical protein